MGLESHGKAMERSWKIHAALRKSVMNVSSQCVDTFHWFTYWLISYSPLVILWNCYYQFWYVFICNVSFILGKFSADRSWKFVLVDPEKSWKMIFLKEWSPWIWLTVLLYTWSCITAPQRPSRHYCLTCGNYRYHYVMVIFIAIGDVLPASLNNR